MRNAARAMRRQVRRVELQVADVVSVAVELEVRLEAHAKKPADVAEPPLRFTLVEHRLALGLQLALAKLEDRLQQLELVAEVILHGVAVLLIRRFGDRAETHRVDAEFPEQPLRRVDQSAPRALTLAGEGRLGDAAGSAPFGGSGRDGLGGSGAPSFSQLR